MQNANPGRVAAARALIAVDDGAHVEDVLPTLLPEGPDRALGWFLALGVLRRRGHVDAALRPHLRQPLEGLDAPVRACLRLGAFEKLHARTLDHAAVHQAVEVAKEIGAGRASGLVNAILRRVEAPRELARADALDHPAWLVSRWDARYGRERTEAWCRGNTEPPPLTVVFRDEAAEGRLRAAGLQLRPARAAGRELPGVVRVEGHAGPVPALPGFSDGLLWVQDAASVAVADLALDGAPSGQGTRVLDACAAPGGKTFRLATRGAEVTAVDQNEARLNLLREGASRLHVKASTRAHDWARGPMPAGGTFDVVLVDAPCTGLGTIRRHPEIRWRRVARDPSAAAARQRKILANAAQHVAVGGALVYAVCSPEPEEGVDIVREFLERNAVWRLEESLDTSPPTDDEDGFQAARLRRTQ